MSTSLQADKRSSHSYIANPIPDHDSVMSKSDLMNLLRSQMMTHTSLRHTKKRSDSSSFDPAIGDGSSGLLSLWKEYESFKHKTGLGKAELMNVLRNKLMTHTSLQHTKKREGSSSLDRTIDDGSSGILSLWNDYDSLHRSSGLSKSELMKLLQNKMMTHTSLRHTKKSSRSSSDDRGSGLLSLWAQFESLQHKTGLSKAELMDLLSNKLIDAIEAIDDEISKLLSMWNAYHYLQRKSELMTHTSLRHTKKRSSSSSFEPLSDDGGFGILSLWNQSESLQHTTELMNLLRNKLMTNTSLRHTKKSSGSSLLEPTIDYAISRLLPMLNAHHSLRRNSGLDFFASNGL